MKFVAKPQMRFCDKMKCYAVKMINGVADFHGKAFHVTDFHARKRFHLSAKNQSID